MEAPELNIPEIPQAGEGMEIITNNEDSKAKLYLILGATALGLFMLGNIMFNISNLTAVKKLRAKVDELEKENS